MKLTKKRIRGLLTDILVAAKDLQLLSSDLSLLSEVQTLANQTQEQAESLLLQLKQVKRDDLQAFAEESEALQSLDEVVDVDIISNLEDHLFTVTDSLEEGEINRLLQQLLEKLEKHHIRLLEAVQQLNALLNDGE